MGGARTLPDLNANAFPYLSLGARQRFRSTHLDNTGTSSSSRPPFNSPSGACSLSLDLAGFPSNEQNKGDLAVNVPGTLSKESQSDIAKLIKSVEDAMRKNKRRMECESEGGVYGADDGGEKKQKQGSNGAEDAGEKNKNKVSDELDLTLKL